MPIKIRTVLFFCLFFLFLSDNSVKAGEHSKLNEAKGYTDIVFFQNNFIAVGSKGRIDCITKSGERTTVDSSGRYNFTCALSNEEILIVAGEHGTILYSNDGKIFYRAVSGTDKSINSITFRNGLFIAGANGGIILTSKNGKAWNTLPIKVKGNILSLSSNNSFFIGVSDAGEIIKSSDGISWEIKDYNKEYARFNQYSKFKRILATQSSTVIIGTHDDGSPSVLFSTMGNVWAERTPLYHSDEGEILYLTQKPNGITYDPEQDQFILACDNGELFTLPSCSKCNKHLKISETNLKAITYIDKSLLIVGDGFSVFVQKL
jgi:hypothetical protein